MAHGVDIALAHEDAVVGSDQHGAEGMMAVRHRLARDFIGGAKVGEHLVAGHGWSLSYRNRVRSNPAAGTGGARRCVAEEARSATDLSGAAG